MTPSDWVRRAAERAGFDRVGIATLKRAATGDAFSRWLADGANAGMGYLERGAGKRLDPRRLLAGARSAVCVALRYWPLSGEEADENDLWSGVARYARGRDYHDVMLDGLAGLEAEIRRAFPGTDTRRYVDTGPVLERDLAAAAGLGAFGKNCNLLDPEIGSWFLIGEVLTTLELEADAPIEDLCGTCTLCLEACPTGALTAAYRLDSRLCISYWTIEHRGPIPVEMRPGLGAWVFGCDVCQEVCPANSELVMADHQELALAAGRGGLSLSGLLALTSDEYADAFRGSSMKRAKLAGLKRNAAVAMGNSGESRYLEPLLAALADTDASVRGHAAWAAARIRAAGEAQAGARQRALEAALALEAEPEVAAEIRAALAALAAGSRSRSSRNDVP